MLKLVLKNQFQVQLIKLLARRKKDSFVNFMLTEPYISRYNNISKNYILIIKFAAAML
jgi:hypothetical protein